MRSSSVFLELFALSQAVRGLLETSMAGGPLSPAEYAFYSVVFEAEAITPTEMGRRLAAPKTTVMEWVRLMEDRGHVRRVPDPKDGRSYRLVLTASGLAAHRRANACFEIAYRAFLTEHRGKEERTIARLAQLRHAVSAANAGSRPSDARYARRART